MGEGGVGPPPTPFEYTATVTYKDGSVFIHSYNRHTPKGVNLDVGATVVDRHHHPLGGRRVKFRLETTPAREVNKITNAVGRAYAHFSTGGLAPGTYTLHAIIMKPSGAGLYETEQKSSRQVVVVAVELLSVNNADPENTTIRYRLYQDTKDVRIQLGNRIRLMGDQSAGVHTSLPFNVKRLSPGTHLIKASGTVQDITLEDTSDLTITTRVKNTGYIMDWVYIMAEGVGLQWFRTSQAVHYRKFKWGFKKGDRHLFLNTLPLLFPCSVPAHLPAGYCCGGGQPFWLMRE